MPVLFSLVASDISGTTTIGIAVVWRHYINMPVLFSSITPEIEFEGETYLFMTQQLSSIPEDVLKDCIGSLEQSRELLIGAIDFAITGI
jgi:toxin CcdB